MPHDKPIDWTKPIETVDGRPARVLCQDFAASDGNCVVVATMLPDGQEYIQRLRPAGYSWPHREVDLVRNKRVKREGWLNLYRSNGKIYPTDVFSTRAIADEAASRDRIACVCIEWEE